MKDNTDYFSYLHSLEENQIKKRFKLLGEGLSRKVYDLENDLVLKLAKGDEGYYQNSVEYFVYTNADSEQIKYLCPILWFTPRIIIMEKAKPLTDIISSKYIDLKTIRTEKNAVDEINKLAEDFLLLYEDIIATNSWGNLNGSNVLIDFGCTNEVGNQFYNSLFYLLNANED